MPEAPRGRAQQISIVISQYQILSYHHGWQRPRYLDNRIPRFQILRYLIIRDTDRSMLIYLKCPRGHRWMIQAQVSSNPQRREKLAAVDSATATCPECADAATRWIEYPYRDEEQWYSL